MWSCLRFIFRRIDDLVVGNDVVEAFGFSDDGVGVGEGGVGGGTDLCKTAIRACGGFVDVVLLGI